MKRLGLILLLAIHGTSLVAADPAVSDLLDKARVARQAGHPADGEPMAKQALGLAQAAADWQNVVWARLEISFDEQLAGHYAELLALRTANLETLRAHRAAFEDAEGEEEMLLGHVCEAYSWNKDYANAIRFCLEEVAATEKIAKANGASALGPFALQRLGINLYLGGRYKEAGERLEASYAGSVAFFRRFGGNENISAYETQVESLRWLERVYVAEGLTDKALATAERGKSRALAATLASRSGAAVADPLTVERIQAIAREHGATLVEYSVMYDYNPDLMYQFAGPDEARAASIYMWVVSPEGKITFRESVLPPSQPSLLDQIRMARNGIQDPGFPAGGMPGGLTALRSLYNLLIGPIASALPADPGQPVSFILQDYLFLLPFGALEDGEGHTLIERHTLAEAPSIQVLDLAHAEGSGTRGGKGALVVGNPTMPAVRGPGGASVQLPPLPGAEAEAQAVAAQFHTTALTGEAATKRAVLERLGTASIVHLATHGSFDQRGPYESWVALAPAAGDDGLLIVREIQDLRLKADLVVLSACDTALGKVSSDGILGLSRAFLTAGSPSVIVSLWDISDESTAYLMERFYTRLEHSEGRAQSLRGAVLETRARYPEALKWAAFTLMGEMGPLGTAAAAGDAAKDTGKGSAAAAFTMPVAEGATALEIEPEAEFGGTTSRVQYLSTRSVAELAAFYREALGRLGLKDISVPGASSANGFGMQFLGSWGDRKVVVSGAQTGDAGSPMMVIAGFEERRDDDSEFSPEVNAKEAGLPIPEHATGVSVGNRFDFAKGEGQVTFLSTQPVADLYGYYRKLFVAKGLVEKPDGAGRGEFWNAGIKKKVVLRIEKSFSHPERIEVDMEFEKLAP